MSKAPVIKALTSKGLRLFPLKINDKAPLNKGWTKYAQNSEERLLSWWKCHSETERRNNIGVLTGIKKGDKYLIVIDIDVKDNKNGFETLLDFEVMEGHVLTPTFTVSTTTGGKHYYYWSDELYSNGVSVIGSGIDIRGANGYVVAPGSEINSKAYAVEKDIPIADMPDWLTYELEHKIANLNPVTKKINAEERKAFDDAFNVELQNAYAKKFIDNYPPAVQGEGGDDHTYRLFLGLKDTGVPLTVALNFAQEWNKTCQPPWADHELITKAENAYFYGSYDTGGDYAIALQAFNELSFEYEPEDSDRLVDEFNSRFFVGEEGETVRVCETDISGNVVKKWRPAVFHELYCNHVLNQIDGKKPLPATKVWFSHKERATKKLFFDGDRLPAQDADDEYNEFRGFDVAPLSYDEATVRSRDALKTMQEHIFENVARGDETVNQFMWTWLALNVQEPGKVLGIAPFLFSRERGTGKSIFISIMRGLMGRYVEEGLMSVFSEKFNSDFDRKFLYCVDEAYRLKAKNDQAAVRHRITASHIQVEHKGVDKLTVKNNLNFLFTSNNDNVFDTDRTERRIVPLHVKRSWRNKPDKFKVLTPFLPENKSLDNGILMGELLNYNTKDFNIHSIFEYLWGSDTFGNGMQQFVRDSLQEHELFFLEVFEEGALRQYLDIVTTKGEWYVTLDAHRLYRLYEQLNIHTKKSYRLGKSQFLSEAAKMYGFNLRARRFSINGVQERRVFIHLKSQRLRPQSLDPIIDNYIGPAVEGRTGEAIEEKSDSEHVPEGNVLDIKDFFSGVKP